MKYEPKIDAHLARIRERTTEYIGELWQTVYKLVLGATGVKQNDPTPPTPPPSTSTAGAAAGAAADLWNTYGQGAIAAGARFVQSRNAPSSPSGQPNPSPSPIPSPRSVSSQQSQQQQQQAYFQRPRGRSPSPNPSTRSNLTPNNDQYASSFDPHAPGFPQPYPTSSANRASFGGGNGMYSQGGYEIPPSLRPADSGVSSMSRRTPSPSPGTR